MRCCLFILFFIPAWVFSQKDTIQNIQEVRASDFARIPRKLNSSITQEDILETNPTDVGDIIRKISGANIKSYGGLGGLKTVSMRSLGASHTVLAMDGFSLPQLQTGQVNLGQMQVDNLLSVTAANDNSLNTALPVSMQVSGSSVLIRTFENTFLAAEDTLAIRANAKYGSFGRLDGYLAAKYQPGKLMVSLFAGSRQAQGRYPYSLKNGLQNLTGTRENNDYRDFNWGTVLAAKFNRSSVRIGYRQKEIKQGLPGAVIFYNQTQDERLTTDEKNAFMDYTIWGERFSLRMHASGLLHKLEYRDPDFLNGAGGINTVYNNRSANGGATARLFTEHFTFFGGIEQIAADLTVDDSLFAAPVRFHNYGLLGAIFWWKRIKIKGQLSSQYVSERNNNGENAPDQFRINPFLSIELGKYRKHLRHQIWYKNTFRMPSFNELYYNNVGNNALLPEDAHQVNYGISIVPVERKLDLHIRSNVFYNEVRNKIVAIPTQNLFVWSMQNIGTVRVYGFDAMVDAKWNITSYWKSVLTANYTYQRTLDYTDEDSPTYRNQVAYIPLHTANMDLAFYYKKTGLRVSNYFISERYTLNENVPQNKIDGFIITDVSIFHTFKIGEKHHLRAQGTVKNVFNNSYAYIRSFVMPGTNFLISMSYAFN